MSSFLEEIDAAVKDYSRVFPVPCALAPNLQLAVEAAAEVRRLQGELQDALAAVGLPEGADLATLIAHHRAQAGAATAFEMLAAQGRSAEPLSDGEWRAFQAIPEQGYSHRHWVDTKIAQRVAASAPREPWLEKIRQDAAERSEDRG